ncbi:fam-f protein [Plasmodium relictum]|uniref:Fam-f protein n=1 Tax=Plasmodium relictum TaxID=85471 RepID=A0A1J1H1C8_PLARL|nr:fam-f protein [Plasmodium relictum]CRG98374.1 fam-f protein [Plasmodium relictum]
MKRRLVLIYYLNFLHIITIIIALYGINSYSSSSKFKLKFEKYKEIQLIRNLAEVFDFKDDDILNDSGLTIKEVQLLYNIRETEDENTVFEGYFGDSRALFIKLVDLVFLGNLNEKLEQEKKNVSSIYFTMQIMKRKTTDYLENLLGDINNHINYVFKDLELYEHELCSFTDVNVDIYTRADNERISINQRSANEYFKQANFSKIHLRLENSFSFFNKLYEKNNKFLSKINNHLYHHGTYTANYIGKHTKRFPLKYAHASNLNMLDFVDELKNILDEFNTAIFGKNKKGGNVSALRISIRNMDLEINNMHRRLDDIIAIKTNKLFVRLNKILNGDIKCLIAFILSIFEQDKSINKFTLDKLKDKHRIEVFQDQFLFRIYELLLQEKGEIKKSLNEFKTYIKAIFGFDVNSSGIRSLVQKLYDSMDKYEFLQLFQVIVHLLGCKRQLNDYSNFMKLLKNESISSLSIKFENLFRRNKVLYIPENKSENLILKFLDMYENSIFFCGLKDSNSKLIEKSVYLNRCLRKFRTLNSLISFLIKELDKSKKCYSYSENKLINKNAIIFFLYKINNFNESGISHLIW